MADKYKITLTYSVDHSGKSELSSIFSTKSPLSRMDKILLERKPLLAKLSIGEYKLISDFVESRGSFGVHYIQYEEENKKPKKK